MAETPAKKRRLLRKVETVRERSNKPVEAPKIRRLSGAKRRISAPIRTVVIVGKSEHYLPLPKNKFGNFLNKRRRLIPAFLRHSFNELRLVAWPNRRNTINLSLAVFVFAFFFGLLIAITDFGLDKLFKKLIIK